MPVKYITVTPITNLFVPATRSFGDIAIVGAVDAAAQGPKKRPVPITNCLVPESHDAILTRDSEEALWQTFFTAAPAQRREFEPSSKRRKRRAAPLPGGTV